VGVEEIHRARQVRIARRLVPDRGTSSINERLWSFERARTLALWPEVERAESDGTPFWRIRPEHARAGATVPASPPVKAHVQPDFEILAPRDMALADVALLARVAELRRADVVATFVLTAASARYAVRRGMSAPEICQALQAIAAHGVPPTLERAVKDWTGDMGRCTVRTVVLASFDEPAIADRALAVLGKSAERLSPTCLAVPEQEADAIERRLTNAAMAPRHADGQLTQFLGNEDDDDDDGDRWNAPAGIDVSEPPDALWLEKLHALRTDPTLAPPSRARPAATASKGVRLPPPVAVQRALTLGADLLVEIGGTSTTIRPLAMGGTPASPAVDAMIAGRPGFQSLRLDEIQTAVLLPATARAVPRNAPCPCGSGRKFKRCCLNSDEEARPT
jgi:hypothetical protein